jgi:hypothetical protein
MSPTQQARGPAPKQHNPAHASTAYKRSTLHWHYLTSCPPPHSPSGHTALARVCAAGREKAAVFLIDVLRADPFHCNGQGETPLHAACASGHVALVDILAGKAPQMLKMADVKGCVDVSWLCGARLLKQSCRFTCLHSAIQFASNFEEVCIVYVP